MPDEMIPQETTLPLHGLLVQMASAYWVSCIIHSAAQLGLADRLASGPKSAKEIAAFAGLNVAALNRLMRSLASLGVLTETEDERFALTPMGDALKSDAPGYAHASVLTICSPWFTRGMQELTYSVRTGKSAFENLNGMPVFDFLSKHPDKAARFNETMIGIHGGEPMAVAEAYDFSAFATVVDVGGSSGNVLATILERHQDPRGILADLPHVVKDAPALLAFRGVAGRVTIEPHDFFKSVPEGGDAYVLSHVIHDWSEAQCLTILGNVHQAMPAHGRLLIIEMVLPGRDEPHFGKILDMVMLALPGGEERTAQEYEALLAKARFRLTRVVPTQSTVSIIEAVKL